MRARRHASVHVQSAHWQRSAVWVPGRCMRHLCAYAPGPSARGRARELQPRGCCFPCKAGVPPSGDIPDRSATRQLCTSLLDGTQSGGLGAAVGFAPATARRFPHALRVLRAIGHSSPQLRASVPHPIHAKPNEDSARSQETDSNRHPTASSESKEQCARYTQYQHDGAKQDRGCPRARSGKAERSYLDSIVTNPRSMPGLASTHYADSISGSSSRLAGIGPTHGAPPLCSSAACMGSGSWACDAHSDSRRCVVDDES
jgi:hypothetical protein